MLGRSVRQLFREVGDVFQRMEQALLALGAERRCAQRLDRLGGRLAGMGARIDVLRSRISGNQIREAVDADWSLRDMLKGLKEDIREIRLQLAAMQREYRSARLQRAFQQLGKVAQETYAKADKLLWEISAHDERYARP